MSKGIRILDKKNRIVSVELQDILKEINYGGQLEWSILYLQTTGNLGEGRSMPVFEQQIIDAEKGLFITWKELNDLSQKFWDLMDIIIIGCKDRSSLRRYEKDQEMYETCDITIEMVDSGYWEVFAENEELINKFAKKFKEVEFLEADFEK
ncbi:MAG: hypothetical protein K1000chlam3_00003 [Chlamydiae bacterium]|nr:hypothetical protein [Chlamydiota bacterium]